MLSTDRSIGLICGVLAAICLFETHRLWSGWPGPGTMPLVIGLILLLNSVVYLARPAGGSTPIAWPKRETLIATAIVAALFAAYVLVLPWVGFLISTWALTTFVTKTISSEPTWLGTIVGMGVLSAVCHFVFNSLLGASLPVSSLGF